VAVSTAAALISNVLGHPLDDSVVRRMAALRAEVRGFLREELSAGAFAPRCDSWLSGFDAEFSRRLGRRGFIGVSWPVDHGGRGLGALERHAVIEELLAAGAPVAAHWIADRQTGPLLLRLGTDEQKRELLPRVARGECYFCIGMSEPDSGSDLASIRTKAERVNGGWLVNGTKLWTSGAHLCHYMLTLVRTSRAQRKHEGMSQLIVDLAADGVEVRAIRVLNGEHHFNEVVLRDAFVPDAMLVGTEGNGWEQVTSELAFERSGPERILSTYPLLQRLVDAQAGSPDDRTAEAVGRLTARIGALRQLSLGIAVALSNGASPTVEAAVVKDLGTRTERDLTEAIRAVVARTPDFEDLLRDATLAGPGFTLRGGTNEILRGIVARGLTGR
jgi:acyl-CoA dehydrogenase